MAPAPAGGIRIGAGGGSHMWAWLRRSGVSALGVAMVALVLAGCGGGAAAPAQGASGGTSTAAAKAPFSGQTLVVTSYGASWQQFMENTIIPPFEKQTGAKVQLAVGLSTDWIAKLKAAGPSDPP